MASTLVANPWTRAAIVRPAGNGRRRGYVDPALLNKHNVQLTPENVAGKKVTSFDEIPVKRCDSILLTEAKVA